MTHPIPAQLIDEIIRSRQTCKVLADQPLESRLPAAVVRELIEAAGWAPFHLAAAGVHRRRLQQESAVPWRFYVVPKSVCIDLRQILLDQNNQSKLPNMLAAADYLIQVTWCPDPVDGDADSGSGDVFAPTEANMEHIAATAAAIQNLLLAATARGIASYWSSGGALRSAAVFERLGMAVDEVLLGAVFLFPEAGHRADVMTIPGKMRQKRGAVDAWCRWVERLADVAG